MDNSITLSLWGIYIMTPNSYEPIINKIRAWINYDKNRPKSDYVTNRKEHDEFRRKNDLDCVLTNGNLNADTILSLWLPLRLSLVRINGYDKLNKYGDINNKISFLKKILSEEVLEQVLPQNNETVKKLLELFELGQKRCNVMILKERSMQSRGLKPYYDYMPYFLYECFDNGNFSQYFHGNKELLEWISDEKLNVFFVGNITKENIRDLSESGNVKNGLPKDINNLLDNYITILKTREALFE